MIVTATYKGYTAEQFIFLTQHRIELRLRYYEMCGAFYVEPAKLAKIMQKHVGKKFEIAQYWGNYGYYVKQLKNKTYELFDSVTQRPVGVSYAVDEGIPLEYEGKPIQQHMKRIVLRPLKYDTNKPI